MLDAKRGGPRWQWQDARGVTHEGYMETFSDRGGTDVTYFMSSRSKWLIGFRQRRTLQGNEAN